MLHSIAGKFHCVGHYRRCPRSNDRQSGRTAVSVYPQLAPAIIGGAMLAFIISMDDLVITYFIAGVDATTLPLFILSMVRRGIKPEINAIATVLVSFSLVVAATGLYLRRRQ